MCVRARLPSIAPRELTRDAQVGIKIKRGQRTAVEAELAKAMERLEVDTSTADELKKAQLTLKCVSAAQVLVVPRN